MGVQNNRAIKHLEIAKNVARTTGIVNGSSISGLVAGEVVVVDMSNNILDITNVIFQTKIKVVQSQGSTLPPIISPVISIAGVRSYSGAKFQNTVQGVNYYGFDGTSGSVDAITFNPYTFQIYTYDSPTYAEKSPALLGYYKSTGTVTQQLVADNVTLSMYMNKRNINRAKPVTFERVCNAADSNLAVVATFTQDSPTVTFASNVTLAAGDYIRVLQTSNTTAVYKVKVGVTAGTTITLDIPWDAASTTAATPGRILAAAASAADFGFKVTSVAQPFTNATMIGGDLQEYYYVRYQADLLNFGATSTTNANAVVPVTGWGLPAQVAVVEQQLLGNEGFLERRNYPFISPRQNVNLSATGYSYICLEYNDRPANVVLGLEDQPKQLDIVCELSNATVPAAGTTLTYNTNITGGAATGVLDVLNSWLTTNANFNAIVLA